MNDRIYDDIKIDKKIDIMEQMKVSSKTKY